MKLDFEEIIQLNEYPREIPLLEPFLKFSCPSITCLYLRQPWLHSDKFNFEMYGEIIKNCSNL